MELNHTHLLFLAWRTLALCFNILMLIKRRPPQVYAFADNNYIHEHVICLFVCFVALRPKSTAMVIAGRSVHLTTLFPGQA